MLVRSSIAYGGRLLVERLAPVIQGTTVYLNVNLKTAEALDYRCPAAPT